MDNNIKWMNSNNFLIDYEVIHNLDFLIIKYLEKFKNNEIEKIDLNFLEGIDDNVLIRFLEDRNKPNIFNWLAREDFDINDTMYNTWKKRFPLDDNIPTKSITDFIKGFINFCYTKNSVKTIYINIDDNIDIRKKCLMKIFGDKYHLIEIISSNNIINIIDKIDVIITTNENVLIDNINILKSKISIIPNQSFRFKKVKEKNIDVIKSIHGWEMRNDIYVSFVDLYKITSEMYNYG